MEVGFFRKLGFGNDAVFRHWWMAVGCVWLLSGVLVRRLVIASVGVSLGLKLQGSAVVSRVVDSGSTMTPFT